MSLRHRAPIDALARAFLAEDVGRGDHTTLAVVSDSVRAGAAIVTRESAVIAGLELAEGVLRAAGDAGLGWRPEVADGDRVEAGRALVTLEGRARAILTGERTALNLLGRLSGVATTTRGFVDAVAGTATTILDTRKTTPGLRVLEKYAVTVGGGSNHRFGLDDGILIKDNHLVVAGGIDEAVARARRGAPPGLKVQVEVDSLDQLDEALAAGADAVLLDNMTPEVVAEAVARAGGKVFLEASGGITQANVRMYAEAGVDAISIGALTHSVRAIDLSLEVVR